MNAIERARQLIELGETATKAPWKHVGYDSDLVGPYNRVCEFNTCDVYAKRDVSIEIEQDVVNAILISNYRNHAPEIAKLFLEAVDILQELVDILSESESRKQVDSFTAQPARIFLKKIEGSE